MPVLPYSPENLALAVVAVSSAIVLAWTWLARPRNRGTYVIVALPMLLLCLGWAVLFGGGSAGGAWVGRMPERFLLRNLDGPAAA